MPVWHAAFAIDEVWSSLGLCCRVITEHQIDVEVGHAGMLSCTHPLSFEAPLNHSTPFIDTDLPHIGRTIPDVSLSAPFLADYTSS